MKPSEIRSEWLKRGPLTSLDVVFAMTLSLTESAAAVERLAGKPPPKLRTEWAAFAAQVIAGDEVWYFKSPHGELAGRTGFTIVRAGTPVAVYITSMS